jgi:hypothetical protein
VGALYLEWSLGARVRMERGNFRLGASCDINKRTSGTLTASAPRAPRVLVQCSALLSSPPRASRISNTPISEYIPIKHEIRPSNLKLSVLITKGWYGFLEPSRPLEALRHTRVPARDSGCCTQTCHSNSQQLSETTSST